MIKLSGKIVSQALRKDLAQRVKAFKDKQGRSPGLAVVLVGDDPASQVYVGAKIKACQEVGLLSKECRWPEKASFLELKSQIADLAQDRTIDGILVQLPLPGHLNADELLECIPMSKDVDGLTLASIGRLWADRALAIPCTPNGVMEILKHYEISVEGKNAVVIGRSQIVGKPMAQLLLQANATVTICHSKTSHLEAYTQSADILVVAAGRPRMIGREHIKKGAVVIDVGIHRQEGVSKGGKAKLCGDVRFDELEGWALAATPVPGGVGP